MQALNGDILILNGREVNSLLLGREIEMMRVVREAYELHARGQSSLPHSTFLNFPGDSRNRIIALPAFLAGDTDTAGVKWVSSFPENVHAGLDRASAVIILNSALTGRPEAILEGSIISAKRTAASAALAARYLHGGEVAQVGMIGCGPINFEVLRFLHRSQPSITRALIFDLEGERARQFGRKVEESFDGVEVRATPDVETVLRESPLVSFATTALSPHVLDLLPCQPRSTILHISLRDLSPEAILASDNVVDDIDHVCRARTSIHLAEQLTGSRDFIRCSIAEVTNGSVLPRKEDDDRPVVFSPFGLGVLDLAVARLACRYAAEESQGMRISSFFPEPWPDRK